MIDVGSQYDDGLGFGLNKKAKKNNGEGTKAGRFFRKNINLKNAVKVGMLASEFVPAGTAAKAAIKVKKLAKVAKAGKLATKAAKLANTTVGKIVVSKIKSGAKLTKRDVAVVNQIAVAQDVDPTTPNVMTKEEFSQVAPGETQANAPMVQEPTQAAKGYASNSFTETSNQEPQSQTLPTNTNSNTLAEPLPTTTKNNTMLYVGVGVLGLGIIYALNQKTKTNE